MFTNIRVHYCRRLVNWTELSSVTTSATTALGTPTDPWMIFKAEYSNHSSMMLIPEQLNRKKGVNIYPQLQFPEIWREYVGYDLDLEVLPLIPYSDLVSEGTDYMELVDGNLATCVLVKVRSCSAGLKVTDTICFT